MWWYLDVSPLVYDRAMTKESSWLMLRETKGPHSSHMREDTEKTSN